MLQALQQFSHRASLSSKDRTLTSPALRTDIKASEIDKGEVMLRVVHILCLKWHLKQTRDSFYTLEPTYFKSLVKVCTVIWALNYSVK